MKQKQQVSVRKLVACILCMLCGVQISNAQNLLTKDFTMTKPISVFKLRDNSALKTDPSSDKCTLRFHTFPNGYFTYELELSGKTFAEITGMAEKGVFDTDNFYVSWTGNSNRNLNAGKLDGGIFAVTTASGKMDGLFAPDTNGGTVVVTGQVGNCITDIHSGQTLAQVEKAVTKNLGNMIALKENGTVDGLTRYTAFSYRLKDDMIKKNLAHLKMDDPYAHFYFDSNRKLVKWYNVK